MLLAAALVLLGVTASATACALRLNLSGTLIAGYVLGSAELVLVTEALSPFRAIRQGPLLACELGLAVASLLVWHRTGRPRPPLPHVGVASLRRHPLLVVLGLFVAAVLAFELFLAVTSTPNEWDAMTYHLSRAAAWFQHGSLASFPSHTARESTFPPNAEIQVLFTMVFTGGDRFSALPQFIAQLVLLVAIFGTARRLDFGRAEAAFAALLFGTLTEVALQATTVQNDLIVSAYLLGAIYFVLGRSRTDVALAALSLALALGTKFTALYELPIVLLVAVGALPRRRLAEFAAVFTLAFAAVGSLVYASNVSTYGTPLGPRDVREAFIPDLTPAGAVSTAARSLWRFVDLSGYRSNVRIRLTIMNVGRFAFEKLHIDPEAAGTTQSPFTFMPNIVANEDLSFFGPLGVFLLLPLTFGYAGAWLLRRTSTARGLLGLALPLFIVELSLSYKYAMSIGRFFVMPVALGAALVARVYSARVVSTIFVTLGALFLCLAFLHSDRKPVGRDGTTPVWSLDRSAGQALAYGQLRDPLRTIDAVVPQDARIGYLLDVEDWDYPLYGRRLERRLFPLDVRAPLRDARSLGLSWVVRSDDAKVPDGWTGVVFPATGWELLTPAHTDNARRLVAYVHATPALPGVTKPARFLAGARETPSS